MDECPWPLGSIDLGELVVGVIAVALDEVPMIAFEEAERMHGPSTRGIVEHHDRWVGTAVTPIIRDDGPEVAGLRFPSSGIEHRRPRLIHEDPIRTFQPLSEVVDDRTQVEAGASSRDTVLYTAMDKPSIARPTDPRMVGMRRRFASASFRFCIKRPNIAERSVGIDALLVSLTSIQA